MCNEGSILNTCELCVSVFQLSFLRRFHFVDVQCLHFLLCLLELAFRGENFNENKHEIVIRNRKIFFSTQLTLSG